MTIDNTMSLETTYLVTLTPTGRFVFGDARQGEFGNKNNYFMRSNPFQQQTGVLGFVRHKLLLQNELLTEGETGIKPTNKSAADELIGKEGFNATTQSFGIIKKISPLFIYDYFQYYFPRNFEICDGIDTFYNNETGILENYKVKKDFDKWLVSNKGCYRNFDDIFIKQTQTGIRMEQKLVDDNSFYMQMSYKLKSGFSFAFYVTLDIAKYKPLSDSIVYSGKEKSVFKMKVVEKNHSIDFLDETWKSEPGSNKFLCISDVILENSFIERCKLVLGETLSFQYRETTNADSNHYNRPKMSDLNRKILNRGSIIYARKEEIDELKTNNPFYKIGYNYLVPVKIKIKD